MVERGKDLLNVDRSFLGFLAQSIGGADGLAGLHPAAGHQRAGVAWPVVAAGILVDFGSAAELTPGDYRDILVESTLVEVFHQGADPLVEGREVIAPILEIGAVPIPVAEAHRHAADTCLHQPASHQELVHVHGGRVPFQLGGTSAVAVSEPGTFLLDVQGLQQPAGGQDIEGLLVEAVQSFHQTGSVDVAAESVEALQ